MAPLSRSAHPRPDWSPGLRTFRSARPGRSLAIYIIMCGTCDICVSCSEVGGGLEDVHTVSGSLRRTLTMFGHCSGRPTGVLASPFHCSAIVVALLAGREPVPLVVAMDVPAIGMRMSCSQARSESCAVRRRSCRSCQMTLRSPAGYLIMLRRRNARRLRHACRALHRVMSSIAGGSRCVFSSWMWYPGVRSVLRARQHAYTADSYRAASQ